MGGLQGYLLTPERGLAYLSPISPYISLSQMRSAFVLADLERRGGVAQRMSPLATVADCGALLQAAG